MKHVEWIKPFLPATLLLFFLIALSSNVSAVSATDEFQTPDWVKDAVFYQIMPDKFRNGDPTNDASGDGSSGDLLLKEWTTPGGIAFPRLYAKKMDWTEDDETEIPWGAEVAPTLGRDYHGGDLQGIKEKIPYLKELGVNAIYLNPIYDGPHWHGYSVRDYKSVGRYFGYLKRDEAGNPIYDEEAKQKSIQIFADFVRAIHDNGMRIIIDGVFNQVSADSIYFDRDNLYPTIGAYESTDSEYHDWFQFYEWPKNFERWGGFWHLPVIQEVKGYKDLLWEGPDSVLRFWDNLGVDGYRLDLAMLISHPFWKEFRTHYKQINPEGYMVGEVWEINSRYLKGDELDALMNYPWRDAVLRWARGGSADSFNRTLELIREEYPDEAFYALLNPLSTHDTHRVLTELGGSKQKVKLAVIFQMTYPGAPCIWYGDEVGMTSDYPIGSGTKTRADPFTRRPYPWPEEGYGPFDDRDMDLFDHYKKLIGIRMSYPVLRTGSLKVLKVDRNIYALGRKLGDNYALLLYNNGESSQNVTIDLSGFLYSGTKLTDVLNEDKTYTVQNNSITISVGGLWGSVLIGVQPSQPRVILPKIPTTTEHPSLTLKGTLENDGTPLPNMKITVLLDGKKVAETWTKADGSFSAELTLREGKNSFQIQASNQEGEMIASMTQSVSYEKPGLPSYVLYAVVGGIVVVVAICLVLRRRS